MNLKWDGLSFNSSNVDVKIYLKDLDNMDKISCNRGQNLWSNVKKSSKIGQDEKTLIPVFVSFLTTSAMFYFWKEDLHPFSRHFQYFLISLNTSATQEANRYKVFGTRYHVSLYLWWIEPTLKSLNVSQFFVSRIVWNFFFSALHIW